MVPILYEDKDIIVVHKPAGLESQSSRGFAPEDVYKRQTHGTEGLLCEPAGNQGD